MTCIHTNFASKVDLARIEDSGRYLVILRLACGDCQSPFKFVGLEPFLTPAFDGARVSGDGCAASLQVVPSADEVSRIILPH